MLIQHLFRHVLGISALRFNRQCSIRQLCHRALVILFLAMAPSVVQAQDQQAQDQQVQDQQVQDQQVQDQQVQDQQVQDQQVQDQQVQDQQVQDQQVQDQQVQDQQVQNQQVQDQQVQDQQVQDQQVQDQQVQDQQVQDQQAPNQVPEDQQPQQSLNNQVQDLKKQLIQLNRDLFILEEELLFPANTQVAVFLSLNVGEFFQLDAVQLKLDDKIVTNYLYTDKQIDALHRGGVQRLYLGNVKTGSHELVAVFTGRGPKGRDYRRGATLQFDKTNEAKKIELRIVDSTATYQPEFAVKEW